MLVVRLVTTSIICTLKINWVRFGRWRADQHMLFWIHHVRLSTWAITTRTAITNGLDFKIAAEGIKKWKKNPMRKIAICEFISSERRIEICTVEDGRMRAGKGEDVRWSAAQAQIILSVETLYCLPQITYWTWCVPFGWATNSRTQLIICTQITKKTLRKRNISNNSSSGSKSSNNNKKRSLTEN